jgi:hypothetical protein
MCVRGRDFRQLSRAGPEYLAVTVVRMATLGRGLGDRNDAIPPSGQLGKIE